MLSSKENQFLTEKNKNIEIVLLTMLGDREDQQDCFGYQLKDREVLAVVCDGMGGLECGALAAHTAAGRIMSLYEQQAADYDPDEYLNVMTRKANADVAALRDASGNSLRTGTTMTAVIIKEEKLYWSSVGDSRAYLLRNGNYAQITQDHSYLTVLNGQLRSGMITQEQYQEQLERKEALISFLGIGDHLLIDHDAVPLNLRKGDQVLLVSDGVYKTLDDAKTFEIIRSYSSQEEALRMLEITAQETSKERGKSRDNLTAILIRIL